METEARKGGFPVSLGAAEELGSVAGAERTTLAVESKWAESAFEELFLQHYGRIVAVLFRLLGDRDRAEELANDVFVKLYRYPLAPRPDGNLGGWLYRTATNLGIDALRAAARRQHYERAAAQSAVQAGNTPNPLDEVLRDERRNLVRAVLAALRPAQAQILILRSSGLSYNDLAESLGVQRGSVGTMLARAEREFEKRYLEMYGTKEDL
jgi:RNA polymerase sigma-70 factor, ECF subfamily